MTGFFENSIIQKTIRGRAKSPAFLLFMAQKTYIGVPRDPNARITLSPVITDIGVPTNYPLVNIHPASLGLSLHNRADTNPASRYGDQIGIGVPLNPATGVVSY